MQEGTPEETPVSVAWWFRVAQDKVSQAKLNEKH
jgi:hypothetical protein